jgi:lysophospholipase L1-like esterase
VKRGGSARHARRLGFALIPVLLVLIGAELVGRTREAPRAGDLARSYDPDLALVTDGARRTTVGSLLHPQVWAFPTPTWRVAFVGDSTVWGQLPAAFARGLGGREAGPQAPLAPAPPVEVLNFGIRGAASDRALRAAEAAAAQDLDLLVVYVGHNEVTEARLNPSSLRPRWQRRLVSTLLGSGTARLLGSALDPVRARVEPARDALRATGDAAARPLSPEEWAPIAASYRRNLEAICALGLPTLFVTPVSSLVNPGEAPDGSATVLRDALMSGYAAARLGDPADALAWAERLQAYYPDYGPPRALRGVALLGMGQREAGLAELREARRRDAQPARATEAHFEILAEVARGCGARRVDPNDTFLADPRYLSPEDPLFMDRVHPTLPGNILLAEAIAAAAPLPGGVRFDPRAVDLQPPADEAQRGWKVLDELWRSPP